MSTACNEEQLKREKKNRKQCVYRARKRAQKTDEEQEEIDTRQREYCARRKAETSVLSYAPDQLGAWSSLFLRGIRIWCLFLFMGPHYLLQPRWNIHRLWLLEERIQLMGHLPQPYITILNINHFNLAMKLTNPIWNDKIFVWRCEFKKKSS